VAPATQLFQLLQLYHPGNGQMFVQVRLAKLNGFEIKTITHASPGSKRGVAMLLTNPSSTASLRAI